MAEIHSTRGSFAIILGIIAVFLFSSFCFSLFLSFSYRPHGGRVSFFYLSRDAITRRIMRPLIHELHPITRRSINEDDCPRFSTTTLQSFHRQVIRIDSTEQSGATRVYVMIAPRVSLKRLSARVIHEFATRLGRNVERFIQLS
mgnify:CR=1 FL=1